MSSLTRVLPALVLSLATGGLAFALALLGDLLRLGSGALVGLTTGMLAALLLRQPSPRWPALLGATLVGLACARSLLMTLSPALLLHSSAEVLTAFVTASLFSRGFGTSAALDSLDRLARLAGRGGARRCGRGTARTGGAGRRRAGAEPRASGVRPRRPCARHPHPGAAPASSDQSSASRGSKQG